MTVAELEQELRRFRHGPGAAPPSGAPRLSVAEALAYRNAGNLPDERGRTLRLVLHVDSEDDLYALDRKRLAYEPDYLDPPTWRRPGSAPVNVVPLRSAAISGRAQSWWEDPQVGKLEERWRTDGTVAGIAVPAEYRSFVYKTVLQLRAAGREVTVDSLAGAIARWTSEADARAIRAALEEANRKARRARRAAEPPPGR